MGTVLVVDRSMADPDSPAELYERRWLAVAAVCRQLGSEISDFVTYAEVAREASLEEARDGEFEYVYGANLAHGLALARQAIDSQAVDTRSATPRGGRIVLVTYSMPSAHHTESGDVFVFPGRPPLPETLAATTSETHACAAEGIRVDTVLILRRATDADPDADADAIPEHSASEPAPEPEPDPDPSAPRRIGMRVVEPTIPRIRDLIAFFQDLSATTGGTMVSVRPDDDVPATVEHLFATGS